MPALDLDIRGLGGAIGDMSTVLKTPMCAVPTCLFVTRNFELPLTVEEVTFLTANSIDFFSMLDSTRGQQRAISASRALQPKTFSTSVPFAMLGLCVYVFVEPFAFAMTGNHLGPQKAFLGQGAKCPASPCPAEMDHQVAYNWPTTEADFFACPAHLDWGGPTWRAAWAWMRGHRLQLLCGANNYAIVLDELLADIGICCAYAESPGLGRSETGWMYYAQRVNEKMKRLSAAGGLPPLSNELEMQDGDPGFFFPANSVDDGANITPICPATVPAAYGTAVGTGCINPWYRLPFPIPMEPSDQIYIQLKAEDGDAVYRERFNDEVIVKKCMNPVAGAGPDAAFPIGPIGGITTHHGFCHVSEIPGGRMRFGIGLKGFMVRESVIRALKEKLLCGPAAVCPSMPGSTGVGRVEIKFKQP